jgi:putative transcriptional regulator
MNADANLTGSLLVAHPSLRDPNFRRSIVFVSQHSPEDGAMGFVLNRPIDTEVNEFADVPVYYGGPVDVGQMLLTSLQWRENPSMVAFRAFVAPVDEESMPGWTHGLRVFAGYSGWTPGQLESEVAENTWIVITPTREWIEMKNPGHAWRQVMQAASPLLHLLSEEPDDPGLN